MIERAVAGDFDGAGNDGAAGVGVIVDVGAIDGDPGQLERGVAFDRQIAAVDVDVAERALAADDLDQAVATGLHCAVADGDLIDIDRRVAADGLDGAAAVVDVAIEDQRGAASRLQNAVVDDGVAADVDRQAVGRGVVGIDDAGRLVDQVQPIVAGADAAGAANGGRVVE